VGRGFRQLITLDLELHGACLGNEVLQHWGAFLIFQERLADQGERVALDLDPDAGQ